MKKSATAIIIFLIAFSGIVSSAHASLEPLQIPAGQEITRTISLNQGDTIQGTLTNRGSAIAIEFYMTSSIGDHNAGGAYLYLEYNNTLGTTFSYTVTLADKYTLHFRNLSMNSTAIYILDYSVTTAFSIPWGAVIIVVVIVALILGIMAWQLRARRIHTKESLARRTGRRQRG